jgi:hypothetical protein
MMSSHQTRSAPTTRRLDFPPQGPLRAHIGTIGLGSIVALLALFNLLAGAV